MCVTFLLFLINPDQECIFFRRPGGGKLMVRLRKVKNMVNNTSILAPLNNAIFLHLLFSMLVLL